MKILHKAAKYFNGAIAISIAAFGIVKWEDAAANERLQRFTEQDRYCLQQNIYFEARNISELSMRAVGWVTLNRMESDRYPDSICDVVWQRKQFSWTHDGKADEPSDNVLEQRAWKRAKLISDIVLRNYVLGRESPVKDAMYYHATYVTPSWAKSMDRVTQIDNHIFYR